jgi:serine phosphatase RsbU (regulator of sigma subunit)
MTAGRTELGERYREALLGFLSRGDERGRMLAYDLGHRAVEADIGLLELAAIHRAVLDEFLADEPTRAPVAAAMEFFIESLSTFDMAQRGYQEAHEQAALERDIALTLQRSLLPAEVPEPDGLDLAVRYLPAGSAAEVGGDWYDIVELPGHRVALVVGDVMGHGVRTAAVMGQLRLGTRAYLFEGLPLNEVVGKVDVLLSYLTDDHTATMVVLVFDLESSTATLVRAGHPPPLAVSTDGSVSLMTGGHSRLLGLGDGSERPLWGPVEVASGTKVVLYTDGLLEQQERAGNDPYPQLCATVESAAHQSPADLTDCLIAGMASEPAHDDMCLVTAQLV